MKNICKIILIGFLIIVSNNICFGQQKTDLQKRHLNGKVQSVLQYKIYKNEKDTVFFSRETFNDLGMLTKSINLRSEKFNEDDDSISYYYDKQNRLKLQLNYKKNKEGSNCTDSIEYFYGNNCNEPIEAIWKFPSRKTKYDNYLTKYRYQYIYDISCRRITETETGRGRANTTSYSFDNKGRTVKKVFTYEDEEPDYVKTFVYDDDLLTMTYLEYSPRYKVYREKEWYQFDNQQHITEHKFFYMPKVFETVTFSKGEKQEPTICYLTKKYTYDANNNLLEENHFDNKAQLVQKVEVLYDEKGVLKEQRFYKGSQLSYREEYQYDNKKLVEKKLFKPGNKKPDYIERWKYSAFGKMLEHVKEEDGNQFKDIYLYDENNNEIEHTQFKNDRLSSTKYTVIQYYP